MLLSYAISIVGIILLWLLQYYPNFWLLAAFVVTFGSMIGSRGPLITATAMKIFRGERVGTIFGTISIGSGLGSAFGSWAGGLIHDWTHSYDLLFVFALVDRDARNDPVFGRAGAAAVAKPPPICRVPLFFAAIVSSNQLLNESIAGDGRRECSDVIQ